MKKITEINIGQLVPDDKNFNKGTEYGQHLIEESLRKFGAGRSILIDRNNRVIAGNKIIENAAAIGLDNVIIIETDGTKIVAVKRNDIDLDTATGRELALADNATSRANLSWDLDILTEQTELFAIEPIEWGVLIAEPEPEKIEDLKIDTKLVVESDDITILTLLFDELQSRGFKCKLTK